MTIPLSDVLLSQETILPRVSSSVMCQLQRIGIWRFDADIRTIIIIIIGAILPVESAPSLEGMSLLV